jgi:type VI secretion system protein ImpK
MNDPKQPFDPFGRGDRTIIRPNPAGRRPAAPASAPPSAPPAAPSPPGYAQPPGYAPPPAPGYAPPPAPGHAPPVPGDDWVSSPPPPPPPPPPAAGRALVLKRDIPIAPHENPIMRAAGPLLLLLGRLRVALTRASFGHLMEQVAAAIEDFEKDIRVAGVDEKQARVAKYVVAATADDIVQNLPGEDRHLWTQYSMLSRFFGERIGGVRFFEELDRAKVDPTHNYGLLELQHACLAIGFQGVHRTSSGGAAALQQIQRSLYETLRRVRKSNHELSPRWQGQSLAAETARARVPVWAVASVAGVVLLGVYLLLRTLLGGGSEAAAQALLSVHPSSDITIQRRVFAPPPPPPPPPPPTSQAKRIQDAIGDRTVAVVETPNLIIVRIANLPLFAPGDATVQQQYKGLIARITAALEKEPGTIKVVGHTDSAPIKNVRFPSNFHLSVERAKAVAALMKTGLTKPDRVEVEGKGADVPVATNETPEGRLKNRRVEISIQRSG